MPPPRRPTTSSEDRRRSGAHDRHDWDVIFRFGGPTTVSKTIAETIQKKLCRQVGHAEMDGLRAGAGKDFQKSDREAGIGLSTAVTPLRWPPPGKLGQGKRRRILGRPAGSLNFQPRSPHRAHEWRRPCSRPVRSRKARWRAPRRGGAVIGTPHLPPPKTPLTPPPPPPPNVGRRPYMLKKSAAESRSKVEEDAHFSLLPPEQPDSISTAPIWRKIGRYGYEGGSIWASGRGYN